VDHARDLRLILAAVRDGLLAPARAAELGAEWTPADHPAFLDYLAARGVLSTDQVNRLSSTPGPAAESGLDGTTATAAPPAGRDGTITFDPLATVPSAAAGPGEEVPPAGATGRYEPIRHHRSGGLGQVWLARDTVLGREVALKMLRPERVGRPDLAARFIREARITGRLEHPAVVPLYDLVAGTNGDGRGPCYAMRFVAGRTLAEAGQEYHARRARGVAGPLELTALLDATVAVCRAVAFAHARGVLHRDLKGQNVVLGDFGEVFLLDWGLAKPVGGPDDDPVLAADGGESEPGGVAGTPAYMAPEVAAGGRATKASDVYGLGAILYSVLTGHPPAEGRTPADVLHRVRSAAPPPPRAVNPAVAPALEAVCRKAMARDPAGRYASAADVATDIRRWLADEPVTAYRDPWLVQAGRWARRHRTAVATAGVLLATTAVALAVGSGLLWQEERRTAAQRDRAEAERVRAEANLDAAHRLTTGLIVVTEQLLPPVRGSELARRDLTQAAARVFRTFAEQRPDDPEVRRWNAQLHRYEANLHRLLDDTAAAEEAYQVALATLRDDDRDEVQWAVTLRDYAGLQGRTGRLKEAGATLAEALGIVNQLRAVGPPPPELRRAWAAILIEQVHTDCACGRYEAAAAGATEAVGLLRELTGPAARPEPYDPVLLAVALTYKATAERGRAGYAAALPPTKEARDLFKGLVDQKGGGAFLDDVVCVQAMSEYEACRTWLAGPKEALKSAAAANLTLVLARFRDLTDRHPYVPYYRALMARAALLRAEARVALGRPADARADYDDARAKLEPLVAAHPAIPEYRADLGRAYLGLGRVAAAGGPWQPRAVAALAAAAAASPDDVEIRASLTAARAAGP